MNKSQRYRRLSVLLLAWLSFFYLYGLTGCAEKRESRLQQIWKNGKITVITDNNEHCYFIYKDAPAGFEYELALEFAKYLVVDLEVVTPGWDEMFELLTTGKGDFIAASLTRLPARETFMDFSDEYLSIQQFIIVHKDNKEINMVEDLNGKTIHVRSATSYQQRMAELKKEGLNIQLALHKNVPTEELIRQVAEKEIEVTVADTNVALLNRRFYPDITMAFPVTAKQSLAWGVRKNDKGLLEEINKFFVQILKNGTFEKIYDLYYGSLEIFDYVDLKTFQKRIDTRLPKYKKLIEQEAAKYDMDWRLIAAIMYQESHFDPKARSHTGVRGLMQLTLKTAEELGVENRLDPVQSIRGGVKYLNGLYHRFDDIDDNTDRMLFALASYNVGYGHVRDAQKIAEKLSLNPQEWKTIKKTLPLLSFPEYNRHTRYGYARGTEPVRYVDRIITYFDVLRKTVPG